MHSVSVTEAKSHLSRLLARVRDGETILLLYRGRPIARLEPVRGPTREDGARFEHLIRSGIVKPAARRPDLELVDEPAPKAREGRGLLGALLADREEGR